MARLLLICVTILLFAQQVVALEIPRASGYVTDRAGLLSQKVEQDLERYLREFENSDSTQITVLTIPTLDGENLETFSLKVFEDWKIGQLGKDNGALLLITKAERKIRIEVGYGLEGRLTDLIAGRIIDYDISPRFKQGDFNGGVISGVQAMTDAVRGEYSSQRKKKKRSNPFGLIFFLFFFGPFIGRIFGRRSYRSRRSGIFLSGPFIGGGGGFGGGGFGGGGFSGGGGGGGGGGASGGW